MSVHRGAKYLHIGCDEVSLDPALVCSLLHCLLCQVYHLGECGECEGAGRTTTFVNHVTRVARHANTTHHVTPLIWDDMLRNLMVEEMAGLAGLVEPMVWVYAEDVERFAPSYTWDRYNQVRMVSF